MTPTSPGSPDPTPTPARSNLLWTGLGAAAFLTGAAVAYRPTFDTGPELLLAALPWLVLAAGVVTFLELPVWARGVAVAVVFAGWAALLIDDDRWSVLGFGVYLLCFTFDEHRPIVGIVLSGIATAIWAGTWAASDSPRWTLLIPGIVFVASTTLSAALHRTARSAREQAALVAELRATRAELADSERTRGALEERTRMAGEIHDTLAQGFTSIVLLARNARRSASPEEALASIEASAEEYLAEARRIVRAQQPRELEGTSLHRALERQVDESNSSGTRASFRVVGNPLLLTGDAEVTMLRGAQEALRNVRTHARASQVEVTLSYLDDGVALDIRDDGVGFTEGDVDDRGSLTGGQGLESLARRAEQLGGALTIESGVDEGSVISLYLPIGAS